MERMEFFGAGAFDPRVCGAFAGWLLFVFAFLEIWDSNGLHSALFWIKGFLGMFFVVPL